VRDQKSSAFKNATQINLWCNVLTPFSSTLSSSNLYFITMLGKKLVLGAIATILSFAATVTADSVLALTPKDFDKARICAFASALS